LVAWGIHGATHTSRREEAGPSLVHFARDELHVGQRTHNLNKPDGLDIQRQMDSTAIDTSERMIEITFPACVSRRGTFSRVRTAAILATEVMERL